MTDQHGFDQRGRRTSRRGRARKRAIRAQAARAGVAYSVAARQLEAAGLRPGEMIASAGCTVHPASALLDRRTFDQRRDDARRAGRLPSGRAQHLVERFPPVGDLYTGAGRGEALRRSYAMVVDLWPGLVPEVGDLAWTAEMGEQTAVDTVCADLDRAARELLESEPSGAPFDGAREILDALLVVANDGHAPGTRVRMLGAPHESRTAVIIGAVWGTPGPPVAYRLRVEGLGVVLAAVPGELVVLAGQ